MLANKPWKSVNIPKLFAVYSGSMEPAIKTGSLVVSLPQASYKPGDIITFNTTGSKEMVTHRLVFKIYDNGVQNEPTYITGGDANEELDIFNPKGEDIIGKEILTVPYGGYVADFAKKPYGFILLVIVPATIIIYEELKFLFKQVMQPLKRLFKTTRASSNTQSLSRAGILLPLFGSLLVVASLTVGYFFDMEKSLGNILGAGTWESQNIEVPSPTTPALTTIFLNQLGGDIGDQYGYWLDYTNASSNNVSFTYQSPATSKLSGTLLGTGLKPYATYQVKFGGIPTCLDPVNGNDLASEYVGYKGRWTCVSADCSSQTALQRNRSDAQYEANKAKQDSDTTKECIAGYLVWDHLTADSGGTLSKEVSTSNSFHVLGCEGAACGGIAGTYLTTSDSSHPSVNFCPADKVDGQIERGSCGGLTLDPGNYHLQMSLTEESFHQGSWSTVLFGNIDFEIQ